MFRVSFIIIVCLALVSYATAANILPNPSFEEEDPAVAGQPSHWWPWGTWAAEQGTSWTWSADAHTGSRSIEMSNPINETLCWITSVDERMPVNSAMDYDFSINYKLELFNGGYAKVFVPWFGADGGWLGNSIVTGTATGTTNWIELSGRFTPPTGATQVGQIMMSYTTNGGPNPMGNIYYDDISMVAVPEPCTMALLLAGAALLPFKKR